MKVKKVGIVGTGVMGSGIAQVCAMRGYKTIIFGRSDNSINRALKDITSSLVKSYVAKGKMTEEQKNAFFDNISSTKELKDLADCDIMIEAIVEDLKIKQDFFANFEKVCPNVSILASDTAGLSVTKIADATKRRERVIGLHMLSPVPQSRVIELIRPSYCSEDIYVSAREFCESLGKQVIVAKDTPGFIINRLLTPLVLGAARLFEQGVATKEDIDNMMKLGAGHALGPIELLDLAGLENYCNLADHLYEALKDESYKVPDSMRKLVKEGNLGRKTGKGFYDWSSKERR